MAHAAQNDSNTALVTAVTAQTAFTLFVTATTLRAWLPLQSALSGATFVAKTRGIISGVTKTTGGAFLDGAPLSIGTNLTAVAPSSAGVIINAYAWGDAASADTTMNVELVNPIAS